MSKGRPILSRAVIVTVLLSATMSWADGAEAPRTFGLGGFVGAALDRGGFEVGLTARAILSQRWNVGVSLELSPWFDLLSASVAPGVANAYASASWCWFSTGRFDVRSIAHLGTSVLLFEPVGARRGSVGVFAGLSLISVSIKLTDRLTLDITPDVALSIPSLSGVPLLYRQYRLVVSLVRWL